MEIAAGVNCHEEGNISGVIIQGTGPSPTAKQNTKETRKKGAIAGYKRKELERAIKLAVDPATLNKVIGRLPVYCNKQMATGVIPKLMKAKTTGVQGLSPTMRAE